ncbi:type II secretion system F family protein [Caenispirillum bisanense]|uniref:Tight adherence protein C n=1 Tax=Caenispirillum bisanense TaxID=414052 RepID=A0A286GDB1_9PROT|nr:type II secretion system F family protein [Caenispirillum bisanense]SOD93478.1 tight adherence protein C [Caenispirillum bisanense]
MDFQALLAAPSAEIVVLGGLFLAVVLAVAGVGALLPSARTARRMAAGGRAAAGGGAEARHSLRHASGLEALEKVLRPLAPHLTPARGKELSRVRTGLVRAGFLSPTAVTLYYGIRLGAALAMVAAYLLLLPLISRDMTMSTQLLVGALMLALGFYGPAVAVWWRARERGWAVRSGFPDALDLMLVCVEAGMGLDAAIARTAEEISLAHPVLAQNLRITSLELRAGGAREDALRGLANRTGVDEVNSFATLLIQSHELGTSVGDTLRVYADDMRYRRMMAAEEKAQKLPAKMIMPMAGLLLPALVIVILLPAIIRMIRVVPQVGL